MEILKSNIDKSVNIVEENLKGFIESRYVRRKDEYFIAYLSSQTGCNRGCKFCHLTATGQTLFDDETPVGFFDQFRKILNHYNNELETGFVKAKWVNINFMARGEALANTWMLNQSEYILKGIGEAARLNHLASKFNISTIMPKTLKKSLVEIFPYIHPTIYYSYYSANEQWRKKWMPGAMPVKQAFELLKEYQQLSKKVVKIHHCFIDGENDSWDDIEYMANLFEKYDLDIEFNVVRYNPFSEEQGQESIIFDDCVDNLKYLLGDHRVKIIPRVGMDVKASCGMFVNKEGQLA